MLVIHGKENAEQIDKRYTTLELDTLLITDDLDVTNYAVIGPDDIKLEVIVKLEGLAAAHKALIKNYKAANWSLCMQLIKELDGQICPFMDSYYDILRSRIQKLIDDPQSKSDIFPLVDVR